MFFKKESIPITIPANFPSFQTLRKYNNSKVLFESTLRRTPELKLDYKRKVGEVALLLVTSHRYNTWGKDYVKWVAPTLLTQALANEESPREASFTATGLSRLSKSWSGLSRGRREMP
ncbi:hypothetical protein BKA63DRAFT_590352 [Paraphoma chrysanthemicola]|nr:hypothetical protein BKA63DRAFT_590352 [Paraphoma chrysanthemicola]